MWEVPDDRRLTRLREDLELVGAPLPLDGDLGAAVLEEIHAALWPRPHEGSIPTFGAVILTSPAGEDLELQDLEIVPVGAGRGDEARRFADGQRTFLVRDAQRVHAVACLREGAADVARLTRFVRATDSLVVRRTSSGTVDVIAPDAGLIWDGVRWLGRPHAASMRELLANTVTDHDGPVLEGLLELCMQWLAPGGIGATLVWDRHGRGLDRLVEAARPVPSFSVLHDAHYPALRSAIAQTDGAVLVGPEGVVQADGAKLLPSPAARERIPPGRGTRHTSAHRYSSDVPDVVVIVVSESSPVSMYVAGERLDVNLTTTAAGSKATLEPA